MAPGLADVGVMLPYAPAALAAAANRDWRWWPPRATCPRSRCASTTPTRSHRLAALADAFLLHDRPIHVPVEDSVFLAGSRIASDVGGHHPLAPFARVCAAAGVTAGVAAGVAVGVTPPDGPVVLAVGGELKNTFALATGDFAFVSAHRATWGRWASQQAFEASVAQLVGIHR